MPADIEQMLIAWLPQEFPGVRACTETPAGDEFTTAAAGGLIRVVRVGGGRQQSLHQPRVVLDFFKPSRPAAKAFAMDVAEALFWRLPGTSVAGGGVSHVVEVSGPSWAPWDNTSVRRFTATYQLFLKDTPA